jgi:hypothetical protein
VTADAVVSLMQQVSAHHEQLITTICAAPIVEIPQLTAAHSDASLNLSAIVHVAVRDCRCRSAGGSRA